MGELVTGGGPYGGRRSGEEVMSDGAMKVNASGAFGCPTVDETLGLRILASGFNDVERGS